MQRVKSLALVGSPNTGKSTLFNALTGLRSKTSNFPGTTVEVRRGMLPAESGRWQVLDLPGLYSLDADGADERVSRRVLEGSHPHSAVPDAVLVVADATNLERSLFPVTQLAERGLPMVVALNMMDRAETKGLEVDADRLSRDLGCPVVPVAARTGEGLSLLRETLSGLDEDRLPVPRTCAAAPQCSGCLACPFQERFDLARRLSEACLRAPDRLEPSRSDRLDRIMLHPLAGLPSLVVILATLFAAVFSLAQLPMGWIDQGVGAVSEGVRSLLPDGLLEGLVVDGIIGGVGSIVIFVPQIALLFFLLVLLEDSGYLARASMIVHRFTKKVGLPGDSFVPLLTAHACAIPAVMATRTIKDPRDRMATLLVAPFMTCSARLPVYAMLTAVCFPHRPVIAALAVLAAYGLGCFAAVSSAWLLKATVLTGRSQPFLLELPPYRVPSLRTAAVTAWDRSRVFVQQAGTVILLLSVVLWVLATFPRPEAGDGAASAVQTELGDSYAGQVGRWLEPAVEPLGYDWRISVGLITSFAAREMIVPTLSVLYGLDEEAEAKTFTGRLREATRADGTPVFTLATCLSLFVFYVLAMMCVPTLAATRRETGSWRWPMFQLLYMTAWAYAAAFVVYRAALLVG